MPTRITGGADIVEFTNGLAKADPAVVSKAGAIDQCNQLKDSLLPFLEAVHEAFLKLESAVLKPALEHGSTVPGAEQIAEAAMATSMDGRRMLIDSDILPVFHAQDIMHKTGALKNADFSTIQQVFADSINAMRTTVHQFQVTWAEIRNLFTSLEEAAPDMSKLSKEHQQIAGEVGKKAREAMDASVHEVVAGLNHVVQFAKEKGMEANILAPVSGGPLVVYEMEAVEESK